MVKLYSRLRVIAAQTLSNFNNWTVRQLIRLSNSSQSHTRSEGKRS